MKKIIYLLCFSFLLQTGWAQNEKTIEIKTEIKSAIIYLDGAEIKRSKKIKLEKGRTKVIFTGLSPKFNSKNIQVTTTNNVALLAISSKIDYLTNVKEKPRVIKLKDSLDLITQKNVAHYNNKDAYTIEKDMLLKNKSIGGSDNGVSITELQMAADFYRSRIMGINKELSKIDRKINSNHKVINRINNELSQLNAKVTYTRGEITLLLNSESIVQTEIDLKYIVSNAGWMPSYDIRAEDINQPIDIIYRAKVYNNTEIDWNNLKFKLSTGDPNLSATQPKLTPWYLNYNLNKRHSQDQFSDNQGYLNTRIPAQNGKFNLESKNTKDISNNHFIEIAVSELSAEFDIEKSYTIPSNNKPYIMDVIKYNVPTLFKYYSVPKMDRDAFLIARIPNWQDLNLIEGNANIYFGGTYVGQSFISTRSVSDTLDISLGRDKKVIVTRTKMKDFSSKKTFGSNRKETHAYRIIVKNNRKMPINIEVLGQVPVSQDSEIEVNTLKMTNAKKNDLTGELKWQYNIEPNQNQTIDLTFTVKYPKSKPVKVKKEVYQSVRFL